MRSQTSSNSNHTPPFFDEHPVGQSRAYRDYQLLEPGERAHISYLLWRMEYSPFTFSRNNAAYSGRDGASWLRWKMRKFYPNVDTAAEFIDQVATRSEKSKMLYQVLVPSLHEYYDLRDVLLSELHALEDYEAEQQFLKAQEETAAPLPPESAQAPSSGTAKIPLLPGDETVSPPTLKESESASNPVPPTSGVSLGSETPQQEPAVELSPLTDVSSKN